MGGVQRRTGVLADRRENDDSIDLGTRVPRWMVSPRLTAAISAILATMLGPLAAAGAEKTVIADKTLVAWVAPADLTQRGGSVLTIEKSGGVFDAIVLGELAASKWMAGSNGFSRTLKEQADWPAETADSQTLVQIAVVYRDKQITIYRDGDKYADYAANGSERIRRRQHRPDGPATHRRAARRPILHRFDRRCPRLRRRVGRGADRPAEAQPAVRAQAHCLVGLRGRQGLGSDEVVPHEHPVRRRTNRRRPAAPGPQRRVPDGIRNAGKEARCRAT